MNCDLGSHGTRQIELKSRYPVSAKSVVRYDLDLFFFLPAQLGIDDRHFGKDAFIKSAKTYTRFSTPRMGLDEALDAGNTMSPFCRIHKIRESSEPSDRLIYELRMLSNIFRSESRERRNEIKAIAKQNKKELESALSDHITALERYVRGLRELKPLLDGAGTDTAAAFRWCDESVSIKAEIEFYKLYAVAAENDCKVKITRALVDRIKQEASYRKKRGYDSIVTSDDPESNEHVLYHEGVLKKWTQSALYLTSEELKTSSRAGHIAAGIAAAAAMSFAVIAAVLADRLFASYSVPWALLIVAAYILKDRIKDILRSIIIALLPRLAADEAVRLIDPAVGKAVGRTKGLVRLLREKQTPEKVRNARRAGTQPLRNILPDDTVVHYHKRIRLRGARLLKHHTRVESITEILRLGIGSWLERMDDPTNALTYVDGNTPTRIAANRVYHIYAIVELSRPGAEAALYRYRLAVTRDGLVRIENMTQP